MIPYANLLVINTWMSLFKHAKEEQGHNIYIN